MAVAGRFATSAGSLRLKSHFTRVLNPLLTGMGLGAALGDSLQFVPSSLLQTP